jgi:hypothetical protein
VLHWPDRGDTLGLGNAQMTPNTLFSESRIHHVALRVADAQASKAWFLTALDFCVDREFSFGGMDFVGFARRQAKLL